MNSHIREIAVLAETKNVYKVANSPIQFCKNTGTSCEPCCDMYRLLHEW